MTVYEFGTQFVVGRYGEKLVKAHLRELPEHVALEDVTKDMTWQKRGVDFLWTLSENGRQKTLKLDAKADEKMHQTNNVFIETLSSKTKLGCFLTSEADYFLMVDVVLHERVVWLPVQRIKDFYYANEERIKASRSYKVVENTTFSGAGFRLQISPDERSEDYECDKLWDVVPDVRIEPLNW